MQEKHLFEYAVIRVVPRMEREEFVNAGVILYCAKLKFLDVQYQLREEPLLAICPKIDLMEIEKQLQAMATIAQAGKTHSPIAKLDMPSRFRWLTATRSTVVQCSKVHPGFTDNATATLERLFSSLVL